MGGEKSRAYTHAPRSTGSPPHGRGKANETASEVARLGITPAWAGKSDEYATTGLVNKDHPRMGGEKCRGAPAATLPPGSPPHGRGKDGSEKQLPGGTWITPAWAGKRKKRKEKMLTPWDHPRMGGEKVLLPSNRTPRPGSPPHGRGKVRFCMRSSICDRITPAWAGKRQPTVRRRGCLRDHPRMGGEKLHPAVFLPAAIGSPPHGRGKDEVDENKCEGTRITPAWAGKSGNYSTAGTSGEDHPRMGGEKLTVR